MELFTYEIEFVSKLVVLLGHFEEILPRDGLNDAVGAGYKLLELLCIIANEAVCTKTGTSVEVVEVQFILFSYFFILRLLVVYLDLDVALSQEHNAVADISILENDFSHSISPDLQVTYNLINDFIFQVFEEVHVSDHLASELHFLVCVVFLENFGSSGLEDVWVPLINVVDVILV